MPEGFDPEVVHMSLDDIKRTIVERYTNRLTAKTRSPFLFGHAGVGKTAIVHAAAEELTKRFGEEFGKKHGNSNVHCLTINLRATEPIDFLGLPYNVEVVFPSGEKEVQQKYSRPLLIPSSGAGILFLDEANRCDRDLRAALLSLLQDRCVNGHHLGEDWIVVLAGNPAGEVDGIRYDAAHFDGALNGRIAPIWTRYDHRQFVSYMREKFGANNPVYRWIDQDGTTFIASHLREEKSKVERTGKAERTDPRSLEYLAAALLGFTPRDLIQDRRTDAFNIAAMEVGKHFGGQFLEFCDKTYSSVVKAEHIKAEEILDTFVKSKVEQRVEEMRQNMQHDLILASCRALTSGIGARGDKITDKALTNVTKFLEIVPDEVVGEFMIKLPDSCDHNLVNKVLDYFVGNSEKLQNVFLRLGAQNSSVDK